MPDREIVITHLQIIHTWASYAHERNLQFFTRKHLEDIAKWSDDAINLLKEQEPLAVRMIDDNNLGAIKFGCCPTCNAIINNRGYPKSCGCGQAVKWNE